MRDARSYAYEGPPEIRARVRPGLDGGVPIGSAADACRWLEGRDRDERDEPFTYVVDLGGTLLLAPRRSEHVACAGGAPVLAAGEITFDGGAAVVAVTNQSTGYRPDPSCWPAVAAALDRAGLRRPGGFTDAFAFRRCAECGQLNLVKDAFPGCAVCDADLPDPPGEGGPDA
ncbi:hypothetical protein GCM10023085_66290 [Actinomadura viridis]|uniref:Uncharacterized protein n=1 Tax=Actinomadura viridis TaxID=58110 RepID=A0A931DPL0_9ACTN|nr:hypothetical protein [Actinomadura viridis]MBG6091451.1 hypothetical protein [Actinomadura viridis]